PLSVHTAGGHSQRALGVLAHRPARPGRPAPAVRTAADGPQRLSHPGPGGRHRPFVAQISVPAHQKTAGRPLGPHRQRFLVGVARLELAASCSQSWRATNCATPRYILLSITRLSCFVNWEAAFMPVFFLDIVWVLCTPRSTR